MEHDHAHVIVTQLSVLLAIALSCELIWHRGLRNIADIRAAISISTTKPHSKSNAWSHYSKTPGFLEMLQVMN